MSTLKVNTIEPYSGGTVSITGGTVDNATSASYAETASFALNAGDPFPYTGDAVINGRLDATETIYSDYRLQVNNPLATPNYLILALDSGSSKFAVVNDAGIGALGANVIVTGTSLFNGDAAINGDLNVSSSLQVDGSTTLNNIATINNTLNVNASFINQEGGAVNAILQNPNFFSEFLGTALLRQPNLGGGTSRLLVGEKAKASISVNAFSGSYDNLTEVKSDSTGGTFGDYAGSWMTIPEAGTPVMKRGLTIEGLGDYADDAAAATGGVPVDGVYRTGSTLKIRVV